MYFRDSKKELPNERYEEFLVKLTDRYDVAYCTNDNKWFPTTETEHGFQLTDVLGWMPFSELDQIEIK